MALKKIEKSTKSIPLKVVFVLLLLLTGLIFNKISFKKKTPKNDVLGEEVRKMSSPAASLKNTVKKESQQVIDNGLNTAKKAADNVINQVTDLAVQTASEAAAKVSDVIFDNTVGNIIKQVNNLPSDQKEDIKRNICQ